MIVEQSDSAIGLLLNLNRRAPRFELRVGGALFDLESGPYWFRIPVTAAACISSTATVTEG
jgi:hypothetical protein